MTAAGQSLVDAASRPTAQWIWRTQRDGNVRPAHAILDGEVFDEGERHPVEGEPGSSYGCRCVKEIVPQRETKAAQAAAQRTAKRALARARGDTSIVMVTRAITVSRAVRVSRAPRPPAPPPQRSDSRVRRVDFAGMIGLVTDGAAPSPSGISAVRMADGRLRLTGRINSCDVVYEYEDANGERWGELRIAEHVFADDVLAAWQLAPLTDDHPSCFVTPDNYVSLAIGSLGSNVRPDDAREYTLADIAVGAASAIRKIELGKTALSCGYSCERIAESGTHKGVQYSYIQTNYIPNHVSLVGDARGPGCEFIIDGIKSISGAART